MAFRIIWQPQAIQDLASIREYYVLSSPQYAKSIVQRIKVASKSLKFFPLRSRIVPEFEQKEIREIFIDSFRLLYSVKQKQIDILAIIHMARDLTNISLLL
jgi:toxin ParE1/3/4